MENKETEKREELPGEVLNVFITSMQQARKNKKRMDKYLEKASSNLPKGKDYTFGGLVIQSLPTDLILEGKNKTVVIEYMEPLIEAGKMNKRDLIKLESTGFLSLKAARELISLTWRDSVGHIFFDHLNRFESDLNKLTEELDRLNHNLAGLENSLNNPVDAVDRITEVAGKIRFILYIIDESKKTLENNKKDLDKFLEIHYTPKLYKKSLPWYSRMWRRLTWWKNEERRETEEAQAVLTWLRNSKWNDTLF